VARCDKALEEVLKAYLFAFWEISSRHILEMQVVFATWGGGGGRHKEVV
jgi:hypothetical protein